MAKIKTSGPITSRTNSICIVFDGTDWIEESRQEDGDETPSKDLIERLSQKEKVMEELELKDIGPGSFIGQKMNLGLKMVTKNITKSYSFVKPKGGVSV